MSRLVWLIWFSLLFGKHSNTLKYWYRNRIPFQFTKQSLTNFFFAKNMIIFYNKSLFVKTIWTKHIHLSIDLLTIWFDRKLKIIPAFISSGFTSIMDRKNFLFIFCHKTKINTFPGKNQKNWNNERKENENVSRGKEKEEKNSKFNSMIQSVSGI